MGGVNAASATTWLNALTDAATCFVGNLSHSQLGARESSSVEFGYVFGIYNVVFYTNNLLGVDIIFATTVELA